MKKKRNGSSVIIIILVNLLLPDESLGDSRLQLVQMECKSQPEHEIHNTNIFIRNFVITMEKLRVKMHTSGYGTAVTSSGPDANYGLAECYGDLSVQDCGLCYAVARTILPLCYPVNGGRVFLDGCFIRAENYRFFQEYTGPNDRAVCGNRTQKNFGFLVSARQAVKQVASAAPNNKGFARIQVPASGMTNESAYVIAHCWRTLSDDSCRACLENASVSTRGCLPWSEGRALNSGCFMRYSDTNFLNPVQVNRSPNPRQGNGSSRGKISFVIFSLAFLP